MRIAVVTLFPEMFEAIDRYGVSGRAVEQGVLELKCFNPRVHTSDRHQTVDDRPYGGGPGMLMKVQPLRDAIAEAKVWAGSEAEVIYLSPQGQVFSQGAAEQFARAGATGQGNLVLLAGRYEGIDERLLQTVVDAEWSIGDYVLSGGELGAMVMIDAITRLLPGVLGHELSAQQDSFS
ncbi:MAG: tRNA (guanosine(37)-N1)-methyltransferase TrmD, partial [Cellvibrionaceae bacterium]|nr:tRNA (guanosine(37)-N1)-methyltransferase TrmD [Cellvibrionaceae bacterium]